MYLLSFRLNSDHTKPDLDRPEGEILALHKPRLQPAFARRLPVEKSSRRSSNVRRVRRSPALSSIETSKDSGWQKEDRSRMPLLPEI